MLCGLSCGVCGSRASFLLCVCMFVFFAWVDFVVWRSLRCVALRCVVLRFEFVVVSLVLLLLVWVSGLFFLFVALCFGLRFSVGGSGLCVSVVPLRL